MCKNFAKKQLTKNKLLIFEWLKMNHIFVSPYHNHFLMNFNFFFNMYIKEWLRMAYFYMGFLVH
jgi:hypothetical protein